MVPHSYEGVPELVARLKMASEAIMAHPHLSVWCHAITEAAIELERCGGPKQSIPPQMLKRIQATLFHGTPQAQALLMELNEHLAGCSATLGEDQK